MTWWRSQRAGLRCRRGTSGGGRGRAPAGPGRRAGGRERSIHAALVSSVGQGRLVPTAAVTRRQLLIFVSSLSVVAGAATETETADDERRTAAAWASWWDADGREEISVMALTTRDRTSGEADSAASAPLCRKASLCAGRWVAGEISQRGTFNAVRLSTGRRTAWAEVEVW